MLWSIGSLAGFGSRIRRIAAWPVHGGHGRRRARGFTLLEVIVAFTILSIALAALLQAFATGMKSLSAAQASATSVLHARSKLDEVGVSLALKEGESSGEFEDGYVWKVRIARAGGDDDVVDPIALAYRVEVEVTGPGGGALTLTTLRLGAAQ